MCQRLKLKITEKKDSARTVSTPPTFNRVSLSLCLFPNLSLSLIILNFPISPHTFHKLRYGS
jgi:hypothetical protein